VRRWSCSGFVRPARVVAEAVAPLRDFLTDDEKEPDASASDLRRLEESTGVEFLSGAPATLDESDS
jgi:hypothetical protein